MPQLLHALAPHEIGGVGEIDWGTLAVFTCSRSCQQTCADVEATYSGGGYVEEVVWRQPFR